MASWVRRHPGWREPDEAAIDQSVESHLAPFALAPGNLEPIREALFDCMWEDVGILRDAEGLQRALAVLDALDAQLARTGVAQEERDFNLSWHDWLNLRSLVAVSRAIATSAFEREDSRGAHFREDHPETGELETSTYIVIRQDGTRLSTSREPVRFTRVVPGETVITSEELERA
jgi:fumarate reductase flavoprotein subunit